MEKGQRAELNQVSKTSGWFYVPAAAFRAGSWVPLATITSPQSWQYQTGSCGLTELPGDAPVPDVLHPVEIELGKAAGNELHTSLSDCLDCRFANGLHSSRTTAWKQWAQFRCRSGAAAHCVLVSFLCSQGSLPFPGQRSAACGTGSDPALVYLPASGSSSCSIWMTVTFAGVVALAYGKSR